MSDNYAEETRPLFKMLRTEAFRFVIVRYNHFSLVRQLEKDLQSRFPDRPFLKIDAQQADYHSLTQAYFSIPRGFLWVENFGDILKERRDTQGRESEQDADENERRRGITAGLNLRRDKLAKSPIALFVLIPAATDELYARIIMEKMPDLWSFRSMILDLEQEGATATSMHPATGASDTDRRTVTVSEDTTELKRLLALLDESPETETAYRLTLYPQIVTEAKDTGKYDLALSTLDTWESQAAEQEKAWIWIEKGDILRIYGHLEEALPLFVKAKDLAEQYEHKNSIALSYERMGDTYTDLGNLKEALICFEQYNAIEQDLANLYPSDTKFKNNLAISYSKLGSTHTALGNLPQALTFFEQFTELMKELHDTYPQNVSFKNGLAVSYEKLGETHTALGNLPQALTFFEDETKLFKELHAAYPQNVNFKNGLAISYEKLGSTHTALGNFPQALTFFEKDIELSKELHAAWPQNVDFKNGLAISYEKLGSTHTALGNLPQALTFFEDETKLFKELHAAWPQNVSFKNGLAISYYKLGAFSRDQLKDLASAKRYFQQAEQLWVELVRDAPEHEQFQRFLGILRKEMEALE